MKLHTIWAVVACLTMAPLMSGAAETAEDPLGTWNGEGERAPSLDLTGDGRVSGTDGCNRLMGSWRADGDTVTFGQVASTMMYCEGVDEWLKAMATARIDGDAMTVFDGEGVQIGTLTRAGAPDHTYTSIDAR